MLKEVLILCTVCSCFYSGAIQDTEDDPLMAIYQKKLAQKKENAKKKAKEDMDKRQENHEAVNRDIEAKNSPIFASKNNSRLFGPYYDHTHINNLTRYQATLEGFRKRVVGLPESKEAEFLNKALNTIASLIEVLQYPEYVSYGNSDFSEAETNCYNSLFSIFNAVRQMLDKLGIK